NKQPVNRETRRSPKPRHRISHETHLTWLTIGAVVPAALIALCLLWFGDYSTKLQWTLTLVIAGFACGYIASVREHVVRPWQTVTNLLAAQREGDYSNRARGAGEDDALGEALLEVNELGETLRRQRLGAFKATAVLRPIIAEIDVAALTFHPQRKLREEKRIAWQRLVRVLGHELNNSLAPIKSVAGSLESLLRRDPLPSDWHEDARSGLNVIATRAESLSRFMEAYARLARLPPP